MCVCVCVCVCACVCVCVTNREALARFPGFVDGSCTLWEVSFTASLLREGCEIELGKVFFCSFCVTRVFIFCVA